MTTCEPYHYATGAEMIGILSNDSVSAKNYWHGKIWREHFPHKATSESGNMNNQLEKKWMPKFSFMILSQVDRCGQINSNPGGGNKSPEPSPSGHLPQLFSTNQGINLSCWRKNVAPWELHGFWRFILPRNVHFQGLTMLYGICLHPIISRHTELIGTVHAGFTKG